MVKITRCETIWARKRSLLDNLVALICRGLCSTIVDRYRQLNRVGNLSLRSQERIRKGRSGGIGRNQHIGKRKKISWSNVLLTRIPCPGWWFVRRLPEVHLSAWHCSPSPLCRGYALCRSNPPPWLSSINKTRIR